MYLNILLYAADDSTDLAAAAVDAIGLVAVDRTILLLL
jgi:hypothetical protein